MAKKGVLRSVVLLAAALLVAWNRGATSRQRVELEGSWGCGCPQPACVPCPYTPQAYAPYPTVPAPYVPRAYVPQPVAPSPYAPEPTVPLPSLPSVSVPKVHVADPTVMDPVVVDPSVIEPHVLEPQVLSPHVEEPYVAEPSVAEPSVPDVDVPDSDIEQEQQARKDGKPLLRQQQGPDAPQMPQASALASLAFNTAMNLQGQQFSSVERYVALQNRQARNAVYHPCYNIGSGCGAAQQQLLASSQLPVPEGRRGGRAEGISRALRRGVHYWKRPGGPGASVH